jgi:hypothetical protein
VGTISLFGQRGFSSTLFYGCFEFYFTEFALAKAVAKLKKARAFLIIWFFRCNDQHLYLEVIIQSRNSDGSRSVFFQ